MIVSMKPEMVGWVQDAWRKSSETNVLNRLVTDEVCAVSFGNMVLQLLKDNVTLVMVDDEDPDNYIAFVSFSDDCVDHVYVKGKLRKLGFGKQMFLMSKCKTFSTMPNDKYKASWMNLAHFDPYSIFHRYQQLRKNKK